MNTLRTLSQHFDRWSQQYPRRVALLLALAVLALIVITNAVLAAFALG